MNYYVGQTNNLLFRYWDKAPQGFEHLTPGQYKAMQAAGQLPTRVLGLTPTANIAAQYPMAGGYFTRQGMSSISFFVFICLQLVGYILVVYHLVQLKMQ